MLEVFGHGIIFGIAIMSLFSLLFLKMTGRKGRVVSNDDGSISYESRSELDVPVEILNITEKQRFMDGDKVVLKETPFRKNLPDAIVTLTD